MLSDTTAARLPRFLQRALGVGPRYGIARGLVVFGPGVRAYDALDPSAAVLQPEELPRWLAERGESCDWTRESLAAVERRWPEALADEGFCPMVANEVALFLGRVLTSTVERAQWTVWPNGHPVVRVGRTEIDVTEFARDYVNGRGEPPTSLVDRYRSAVGD